MFSLRTLLVTVAIAALGTAALVYRTPWWAVAVVTLTLCFFGFGLVRLYTHPEKRPFWAPACLIGWLYIVIAFFTPLQLTAYLPTTRLVFEMSYHDGISQPVVPKGKTELLYNLLFSDYVGVMDVVNNAWVNEIRTLWAISHSLTALLIGFVGGAVFSWNRNRRKLTA